jgi:hypothetical protein
MTRTRTGGSVVTLAICAVYKKQFDLQMSALQLAHSALQLTQMYPGEGPTPSAAYNFVCCIAKVAHPKFRLPLSRAPWLGFAHARKENG